MTPGVSKTPGVFFIAADGSESRASLMVKNTARQLIFEAPAALAAGDYTLEVRANYGQGTLRAGRLDSLLTVA